MVFQGEILSAPQVTGGAITAGQVTISSGPAFTRDYTTELVKRIAR